LILEPAQFRTDNIFYLPDVVENPLSEQFAQLCISNFGILCKYVLNTEIFPFQNYILTSMYHKSFPLLVGSRGLGKSFIYALYALCTSIVDQGSKIVLVSKSYRQCLTGDAVFFTEDGIKRFEDLVKGTVIEDMGGRNKVKNKWVNEEQITIKITTRNGYSEEGAEGHRVLVGGEWKKIEGLSSGDTIQIYYGQDCFAKKRCKFDKLEGPENTRRKMKQPDVVNEDIAWFVGKLFSKFCVVQDVGLKFHSKERSFVSDFSKIAKKYFNTKSTIVKNGKRTECKIDDDFIYNFFKCNDFDFTERKIPKFILESDRNIVLEFLRSYFESICSIKINKKTKVPTVVIPGSNLEAHKLIHMLLLNFGIISKLIIKKSSVKIEIRMKEDCDKFSSIFGLDTYHKDLSSTVGVKMRRTKHRDSIDLTDELRKIFLDNGVSYHTWGEFVRSKRIPIERVKKIAKEYKIEELLSLYSIEKVFNDEIVKVENKKNITHDIEVANSSRYFASGFLNHNSLLIFDEIIKIYNRAPILRRIAPKRPTKGTTTAELIIGLSSIKAIPLGDGSSVRGMRATRVLVDEFASIDYDIFQVVVRNFASVAADPVKRVKVVAKIQELRRQGKEVPPELRLSSNQICLFGTAWFMENHFYRTYSKYLGIINGKYKGSVSNAGSDAVGAEYVDYTDYIVYHLNFKNLPRGYMDEKQISQARLTMSKSSFAMELLCEFQGNSDGFFKYADLRKCNYENSNSGDQFYAQTRSNDGDVCVMGIDPSSGGKEAVGGIVIIRVGSDYRKIIRAICIEDFNYTEAIAIIKGLFMSYDVRRVAVDAGGGGWTINSYLSNKDIMKEQPRIFEESLLKPNCEDGRYIMEMVNFSSQWILKANNDLQGDFQHRRILFPRQGGKSIQIENAYEDIDTLAKQVMSVQLSLTQSGLAHFDVPTSVINDGENKRKIKGRKDLYSALLLANYAASAVESSAGIVPRYDDSDDIGGWMEEFIEQK